MKYKAFFIIFKGLSLKQTKQFFWEGESPTLKRNAPCEVFYYQSRKYVMIMIAGKIILAIRKWILIKQGTVFLFFFDRLLDFLYYDLCITCKSIFSCINEEQYLRKKPTLRFHDEMNFAIFRTNLGEATFF